VLFLNPLLLLGLAGVAIPVIVHLFNRKSVHTVDWGAMQFLTQSMASRTRRIQLEDALLMATRCLIFGIIALALARPFAPPGSAIPYAIILPAILVAIGLFGVAFALWENPRLRGWLLLASISLFAVTGAAILYENLLNLRRLSGAGEQDIALIIDSSTSMNVRSKGSTDSSFKRAIDEARDIIASSDNRSAFTIIAAGPSAEVKNPSPLSDRSELNEILDTLEPSDGHMRGREAVAAAAEALAAGGHDVQQILVLTDGQNIGWQTRNSASWELVAAALENLPHRPALILRELPHPTSFRNIAVTGIRFARDVIGVDREVAIEVSLQNTGTEAVTPKSVQLDTGSGTLNDDSLGQLPPGTAATVRFSHQFHEPGPQALTALVDVDDDLGEDNRVSSAVNIIERLDVLIVDGNPAPQLFDRASAFIELALAPGMLGQQAYLIEPTVIPAPQILNVQSFASYQAVVLADVARLPARTAKALSDYVRDGGGLLIAPGQRALPEFYNTWEASPAQLREFTTAPPAQPAPAPALQSFSHPAIRKVAEPGTGDFGSTSLTQFWNMEVVGPGNSVVATLDQGSPFVAVRKLGSGTSLMTNCSLDSRSGNISTRESFLPFLHEIIYHIANPTRLQLNLEPDSDLTLLLAPHLTSPEDEAIDTYIATDPRGQLREAEIVSTPMGTIARIAGSTMAGLYEIEIPDSDHELFDTLLTPADTIPFTVGRLPDESRLDTIGGGELEFISRFIDVLQPSSTEDIHTILAGRNYGQELWRPLALAVFALLILEIALSRWIATTRKTGSQEVVEFASSPQAREQFQKQLDRFKA